MIYSLLLFYFYLYFISFYLYFISLYLYFAYSYLRLRFWFVTFYILFRSPINSINCGKQSERLQVAASVRQLLSSGR